MSTTVWSSLNEPNEVSSLMLDSAFILLYKKISDPKATSVYDPLRLNVFDCFLGL